MSAGVVFVSVMAGHRGGAALAMTSGSPRVHSLMLPHFTATAVRSLVAGGSADADQPDPLAAGYRRFHRRLGQHHLLQDKAWRDWDHTLKAVLAGLGVIGWSRLHRWLRDILQVPVGSEVVLSLPPSLASLPVAAAQEPRSGRYFIDDFAVRRIPDASWLIRCEHRARALEREAPALLAVLDPGGDLACDPDWPRKRWNHEAGCCVVLAGSAATPARVRECLPNCTHYVHFGHGSRQRRYGVLELARESETAAGPALLEGAQVQALNLPRNRLSILAACESALSGGCRPSDLRGMAGSFLLAGSACVIGCLWPVESSTTRHLAERTLSRLLDNRRGRAEMTPAQALRMAQLELRDSGVSAATKREPRKVLHLRPGGTGVPMAATICERQLYYWAAFSCLGG